MADLRVKDNEVEAEENTHITQEIRDQIQTLTSVLYSAALPKSSQPSKNDEAEVEDRHITQQGPHCVEKHSDGIMTNVVYSPTQQL